MNAATCPSELALDRYELGELDPEGRAHVDGCAQCKRRLAARHAEFRAIPDRDAILRRIHTETASAPKRAAKARWSGLIGMVMGVGSAAAVIALVVRVGPPRDTTGIKGSGAPVLSVFREHGGQVEEAKSGERFDAGDRLRFQVDLPSPSQVMIVGVESSGSMYVCYPDVSSTTARALPAGDRQLLPGAVRLDRSSGRETLYLVACERPFGKDVLKPSAGALATPDGCKTARFELLK